MEQIKTMSVLNFGSLNIDHVYRLDSIVRPGETVSSSAYQVFAGGKGANQSVALARAETMVTHAGRLGSDGRWLAEKLYRAGVLTRHIEIDDHAPSGHAVIQVDAKGQNAIFLFPGTNRQISDAHIAKVLDDCEPGTVVLLQNEINAVAQIISQAHARGLWVTFNPAPMTPEVLTYPLEKIDLLIVNQTEAQGLAGLPESTSDKETLAALSKKFPLADIIMTLGADGVFYQRGTRPVPMPIGLGDDDTPISVNTRPNTPPAFSPKSDKGVDLGVLLVERAVITPRQLMAAIITQAKAQPLLALEDIVWKMGLASPAVISQAVAAQRGLDHYDITAPIHIPAEKIDIVDTTAAGDTLIGYFLAFKLEGKSIEDSLTLACKAAALCCSRPGAMDSIPTRSEILGG